MIWNLNKLFNYTSSNDPKIFQDLENELCCVSHFKEKYSNSDIWLSTPESLFAFLQEFDFIVDNYFPSHVRNYAERYLDIEKDNDMVRKTLNRAIDYEMKMKNALEFVEINLGKISKDKQDAYLSSEILNKYHHWLKRIFENHKHILSPEEERILTLKANSSRDSWIELVGKLVAKESEEISTIENGPKRYRLNELLNLAKDKDEILRNRSVEAINKIYDRVIDIAVTEMNNVLEYRKVEDELRKFDRPDRYSTQVQDDIQTEIVDVMRNEISKRIHIAHRYFRLKAKLFGKDKLKYNERNLELSKVDKKFTLDESVHIVKNVYNELDEEFAEIWEFLINDNHIDTESRVGKVSSDYCEKISVNTPTVILTNFYGKMDNVLTLAHEGGHAINFELVRRNKDNGVNFYISNATTEVASIFFEDFVFEKLVSELDLEEKKFAKFQKMEDDIASVFRQTACYNFELDLHKDYRERNYLTRTDIGDLFQKHMSDYLGNSIDVGEAFQDWWISWPHIREYFYTYSYASGLLIAKYLQKRVREDRSFIEQVKRFLSTGGTKSVYDIFMELGIDLRKPDIWREGLDEIESNLQSLWQL